MRIFQEKVVKERLAGWTPRAAQNKKEPGSRLPAAASCLGRHAHPAGRSPNSSSLFLPLAAVVAVAQGLSPAGLFGGSYELRLPLFPQPLGRALKKRSAAPASPPCFRRRRRSAPQLFESTLAAPFSRQVKQKLRYPLDTGVLGGAKQSKSEPLPSGASLAAISSKVMVFVPSL